MDVPALGLDRLCARRAAERAVARAVALIIVERHGRDVLALDILPDIQLRPVEQGVNAHMRAGGKVGLELVPELGRLVVEIPVVVLVARGEIALLAARTLLIGASADDDAGVGVGIRVAHVFPGFKIEPVTRPRAVERVGERLGFQAAAALDARALPVRERLVVFERLAVFTVDHVKAVLHGELVAVLDHFGDLIVRVNVDEREGDVTVKRLAREPEKDRRVLADAPEHAEIAERGVSLAQNVHAFAFQFIEMISHSSSTSRIS